MSEKEEPKLGEMNVKSVVRAAFAALALSMAQSADTLARGYSAEEAQKINAKSEEFGKLLRVIDWMKGKQKAILDRREFALAILAAERKREVGAAKQAEKARARVAAEKFMPLLTQWKKRQKLISDRYQSKEQRKKRLDELLAVSEDPEDPEKVKIRMIEDDSIYSAFIVHLLVQMVESNFTIKSTQQFVEQFSEQAGLEDVRTVTSVIFRLEMLLTLPEALQERIILFELQSSDFLNNELQARSG